jgi:hypothetical protein
MIVYPYQINTLIMHPNLTPQSGILHPEPRRISAFSGLKLVSFSPLKTM